MANEITFSYDSLNRLVETVEDPNGTAVTLGQYDYNHAGLRISHLESSRGNVTYFYDGNSVIEERNADDNTLLAHYRYADRLLSLDTGTGTQYYHHDALGSTVNLSDETGAVQVSYRLDPYGQIREQSGNTVNRQVFTGQEIDENTGLIYFGARFYDPDTGRFLTQDSYLGESTTPPSLHRYLYAYSNPTVYIDLMGYASENAVNHRYEETGNYGQGQLKYHEEDHYDEATSDWHTRYRITHEDRRARLKYKLERVSTLPEEKRKNADLVEKVFRQWDETKPLYRFRPADNRVQIGPDHYISQRTDDFSIDVRMQFHARLSWMQEFKGINLAELTISDLDELYHMEEDDVAEGFLVNVGVMSSIVARIAKTLAKPVKPDTIKSAAPKSTVDKSWKNIIHGKAHGTTPGHKFRSYRDAITKAKSGQYSDVYLNTGYKKATGVNVSPNRRPDVIGARKTGQVDAVEVPQVTDTRANLIQRNQIAQQQLPPEMRGRIDIVEIQ